MNADHQLAACLCVLTLLLASCIKEEPKNAECDILEAWVEGDNCKPHFYRYNDMRMTDVASGQNQIVFTIRVLSVLPEMAPQFRLTPGATISPASGTAHDFSKGPVTYTVTSEDGAWKRQYSVAFREAPMPSYKFDFEHYELNDKGRYYVWYEKAADGSQDRLWSTGNEGFAIAKPNASAEDYPSVPDTDGYDGSCLQLTTRDTGSWGRTFKKPIAAGNFFLGSFNSKYALTNTLLCTEMGIPFTRVPVKVKGYYKYIPGPVFTDKNNQQLPDRIDQANIYSVLYRNQDAEGADVMLHGDDVLSSPHIIRRAEIGDLPATDQWTPFEIVFKGDTPIDPMLLANRGYNLVLVFSSSKTGDTFEGAVGSTLWIDKVELVYEE